VGSIAPLAGQASRGKSAEIAKIPAAWFTSHARFRRARAILVEKRAARLLKIEAFGPVEGATRRQRKHHRQCVRGE
jgi:hypothetical protein